MVEVWFPSGPGAPDVGLLKFTAASAESWNIPGGKITSASSFVKSKITDQVLDPGNDKVDLR